MGLECHVGRDLVNCGLQVPDQTNYSIGLGADRLTNQIKMFHHSVW